MPARSRHPLTLALLVVAALAIGACSRFVGPMQWTQSVERVGGDDYTIDVRDTSGRLDEVEFDPPNVVVAQQVMNPAGQPNVLLVSWTGGACDERTDISIASSGPGLAITIRTTVAKGDCDAIGIGHVLQLRSSQPLPANAVTVTTTP